MFPTVLLCDGVLVLIGCVVSVIGFLEGDSDDSSSVIPSAGVLKFRNRIAAKCSWRGYDGLYDLTGMFQVFHAWIVSVDIEASIICYLIVENAFSPCFPLHPSSAIINCGDSQLQHAWISRWAGVSGTLVTCTIMRIPP